MTARRREQIAWWLRGGAAAALLAYLAGWHASRSGGLVEVEQWLNHPVLLGGAAVVMLVVSAVAEFEFRARWSQIGFAAVLAPFVVAGMIGTVASSVSVISEPSVERKVHPDHPDRVLTVTNVAFSIDPVYRVQLLTGSGWSARHWNLGAWDGEHDYLQRAEWSAQDRITVTTEHQIAVFTVTPDGRLGDSSVRPR
ncbi:hypothetical protein ACH4E7_18945 [Kitasatospora sp. NPDC018058]|uniref:hypothetical protein n=1 Tax=Kitasatospora sp. NPDC018058 TaxID=3364025 RepID=UPI0037BF58D4